MHASFSTSCTRMIAVIGAALLALPAATRAAEPTAAQAAEFVTRAETDLAGLGDYLNHARWAHETYINVDTAWLAAKASAEFIDAGTRYGK